MDQKQMAEVMDRVMDKLAPTDFEVDNPELWDEMCDVCDTLDEI